MKKIVILYIIFIFSVSAYSDTWNMFDRRLGMFIHWGIYSIGGYHEQEWIRKGIAKADYEQYTNKFIAENFDPNKWIDAAQTLGAEYIVFTAKHHDGFCMWDTKTTSFNVMNTRCHKDILKELADSCHKRGMKLGLYYSNPDWHHSNAWNRLSTHQLTQPNPCDEPDMDKYRIYVKKQISELLTKYGDICCFFWDIPPKIDDLEMNDIIRKIQPGIKINDRGWGGDGDYSTPERNYTNNRSKLGFTEACDSVGVYSWGYRANEDYHTVGYLTRSIDKRLSEGANFLLNVGPKSDGNIPEESLNILASVGKWYSNVKESYKNTTIVTNIISNTKIRVTKHGNTIYLHFPEGLNKTGIDLYPLSDLPEEAILLNTGTKLTAEIIKFPSRKESSLHIYNIPANQIANESPVIRLYFKKLSPEIQMTINPNTKDIKK